jgi:hypothetical protein
MISNFDKNFYTLYKKYKNKYIKLKNNILEGGNNNKVDKVLYELINNKYYIEADIQRYNSYIQTSILKDDIKQKLYYKEKQFNEIKFNEIKKEYNKINFFNKKQLILEAIEKIIKNKSSQSELLRIRYYIITIINNLNDFIRKNLFDVKIDINNLENFKKIPEHEMKNSDITDELIKELNNIKDILENNKTQSTTNFKTLENTNCTYKTVIQLPINKNITNCNIKDLKKLQEIYKSDLKTINDYYTNEIIALKKSTN